MMKRDAIELLGGTPAAAAEAVHVTVQAVNQWPEILPPRIADRVQAAMWRAAQATTALDPDKFGSNAIRMLQSKLKQAQGHLPSALIASITVPCGGLKELADFLVMLDTLLERYHTYQHHQCAKT